MIFPHWDLFGTQGENRLARPHKPPKVRVIQLTELCDLCGAETLDSYPLRERYKARGIEKVCPTCNREINDHLLRLRNLSEDFITRLFKIFLRNRKNKGRTG